MQNPNYFTINYNLGRTHSAMIVLLVEQWNSGHKEPLNHFLKTIGAIELTEAVNLSARLEYYNVDLAILDGDVPLLLIEMKVDDQQSWSTISKKDNKIWTSLSEDVQKTYSPTPPKEYPFLSQTDIYRLRNEDFLRKHHPTRSTEYFYLTLGVSEFAARHVSKWTKIGLKKYRTAFSFPIDESTSLTPVLVSYVNALDNEQAFRDWAMQKTEPDKAGNFKVATQPHRSKAANLYFLGNLANEWFYSQDHEFGTAVHPHVINHGPKDTIFQLIQAGTNRIYAEINNNCRLNIKLWLKDITTQEERADFFTTTKAFLKSKLIARKLKWPIKEANLPTSFGNSITVFSLDIGLSMTKNKQFYCKDIDQMRTLVFEGLRVILG